MTLFIYDRYYKNQNDNDNGVSTNDITDNDRNNDDIHNNIDNLIKVDYNNMSIHYTHQLVLL